MIKIKYKNGYRTLLFFDRLRVKLSFAPGPAANMAHMAIFPLLDDPECFWQVKINNALTVMARVHLDSVPNNTHHAHLTYRHANQQAQWMTLELHPRDMGLQGFEDLHIILGQFTSQGWGSFVSGAKVTQIEVSIDLEGVPFNSVHILPDQAQTSTVYKNGKQVETQYLGKTKANQTVIYDRAAKRKKLGQPEKAAPCTRIERKKSSLNLKVYELTKLTNPFSHVKFVDVPAVPPSGETKDYMWALFTDAVAQRGLDPALKLLPQAIPRRR